MSDQAARFTALALPHLDAAYNLARWMVGNDHDAGDVTQDAYVKALRHIEGCRGDNPRAWLLAIVRRTALTWLARNRARDLVSLDEENGSLAVVSPAAGPEDILIAATDRALLDRLVGDLPLAFREVLILREIEELSYRDIAEVTGLPLGTVMSRLSRARDLLRNAWIAAEGVEPRHGN